MRCIAARGRWQHQAAALSSALDHSQRPKVASGTTRANARALVPRRGALLGGSRLTRRRLLLCSHVLLQDSCTTPPNHGRHRRRSAGTLTAAQLALEHGVACSTAGGTHHAFPDAGAGFCIVNDLAITTETLLATHPRVDRVLILDLDVHQGDGTAACFSGRDDVFTCSFHAEKNFPTRKEQSTLDVGLPDGMGDATYCRCALACMQHTVGFCLGTAATASRRCNGMETLQRVVLQAAK